MRIGVLTSLYPSGARPFEGIFAERRWQGMSARGHGVAVVHPLPRTPGPLALGRWREIHRMPLREERGGVEIRRPRYLHVPGRALANARRFARVGLQVVGGEPRPEVVVADYAWPAAAAAPLLRAAGIPCVVSGRGSDVLEVAGEAGLGEHLASHLRAAGHWCAVSQDLVERMDGLAARPGHGDLVPNGVDLDLFSIDDRGAARRRLGLDEGLPLVLVVGHLIERKDPLLALEVFRRGAPADARCVFLGRGPLRSALAAAVRKAGLAERVRLAGEVPPESLARWYGACDGLLLTSRREGRPNVVLECLASGRAVLATAAGGTAELLGNDPRLVAHTRDPDRLAALLRALLDDPPDPGELRARALPWTWPASLDRLEACLARAIAEGR